MFEKKSVKEAENGINLILENLGDFVGFYEKNKEEYPLDNAEELINSIGDCTNLTKIRNWKTAWTTKKTSQNSNLSKDIKNNPVQNLEKIGEIYIKLCEYKQKTLEKKVEESLRIINQKISETTFKICLLLRRERGQLEEYLKKIRSGNNKNAINQRELKLEFDNILEKTKGFKSEEKEGSTLKSIGNIIGKTRKGIFYLGKKAGSAGKGTINFVQNGVNLGNNSYRETRV